MADRKEYLQLNIRMESKLLTAFRSYCEAQALDPHQLITNYVQRLVAEKPDFQGRLWETVRPK